MVIEKTNSDKTKGVIWKKKKKWGHQQGYR